MNPILGKALNSVPTLGTFHESFAGELRVYSVYDNAFKSLEVLRIQLANVATEVNTIG